ncbi:hypothetical protein F511_04589 [Dorcoceras hygrometricum]|uniref:carotenoid 9,10-dioxygenase n=1 Tax=Dorcoceras hygrometricum TaxID=472368 RepID=A0A2Z7B269_9LAMI|nr:hypothetical protein F511_04589 [Dorcoceras hygrometricum]
MYQLVRPAGPKGGRMITTRSESEWEAFERLLIRSRESLNRVQEAMDALTGRLGSANESLSEMRSLIETIRQEEADERAEIEDGYVPEGVEESLNSPAKSTCEELRLAKRGIEIPSCNGTDPLAWLGKAERCIEIHGTPVYYRLRIAHIHMEGPAVHVSQWVKSRPPDWIGERDAKELIHRYSGRKATYPYESWISLRQRKLINHAMDSTRSGEEELSRSIRTGDNYRWEKRRSGEDGFIGFMGRAHTTDRDEFGRIQAHESNRQAQQLHRQAVGSCTAKGRNIIQRWGGLILSSPVEFGADLIRSAIESHDAKAIAARNSEWESSPIIFQFKEAGVNCVTVGSSPRFKVYDGNFGWGRPESVRSRLNSRFDGMVYLYPGRDGNFFVGLLLLLMPKENAFLTLVGIPDDYFDGYYSEEMIEAQGDQIVLEELIREKFPKLVNHLDYLGVQVAWVTGPWFLSIFMKILPWESVLRVWDVLLFQGNRVMLFRTALSLMELHGPALVTTKDAGDDVTVVTGIVGCAGLKPTVAAVEAKKNKMSTGLKVCASKAPGFGKNKKSGLQELAVLTRGQELTEELGLYLDEVNLDMLGSCEKVSIYKDATVTLNGAGEKKDVEGRSEQSRSAIKLRTSADDKEKTSEAQFPDFNLGDKVALKSGVLLWAKVLMTQIKGLGPRFILEGRKAERHATENVLHLMVHDWESWDDITRHFNMVRWRYETQDVEYDGRELGSEMFTFGYSHAPPYITYRVISSDGIMRDPVPITVSEPIMMHDFAITENYAIFMDLPLYFRPKEMVKEKKFIFSFDPTKKARFGILPRYAKNELLIKWFELPNCFIFHNANAWEEGDEVVLITCRLQNLDLDMVNGTIKQKLENFTNELYEMRFNLKNCLASQKRLSVSAVDFPRINESYTGRKSQVNVIDAKTMSPDPVAIVDLPSRVPYGFHAFFVTEEQLREQAKL